jgi:molybdopterin/thiamine biosynthesis adenylyltransferase/nitroreductase
MAAVMLPLLPIAHRSPDEKSWRPKLMDAAGTDLLDWMGRLEAEGGVAFVHDEMEAQLLELLEVDTPDRRLTSAEQADGLAARLGGRPAWAYGTWVHYPWSKRLVHLLPEGEFHRLRTSRNRHKITPAEQARLRRARVGVVGLSVGNIIAATLAMEGVAGEFRLADFDRVALSNTNRILCGVSALQLPKAVQAARTLYEIDPYLNVTLYPRGLDEGNIDEFLGGPSPLDVVIEECDNFHVKLQLREQARSRGIPVIMETNDRGMLDVERFDQEHERPLLHGLVPDLSAATMRDLSKDERTLAAFAIAGGDQISPRMAASLIELDSSIVGWSQLGSGTVLGGAVVTEAVRRLLLGNRAPSGRYYVDLERILSSPEPVSTPASGKVGRTAAPGLGPHVASPLRPLLDLIDLATLAPSGGNQQPWRFTVCSPERIRLHLDGSRLGTLLDYRNWASLLACGAAVENLRIAAAEQRLHLDVEWLGGTGDRLAVCDLNLGPSGESREHWTTDLVRRRMTNRRLAERVPLPAGARERLEQVASRAGAELTLLETADALDAAGRLVGGIDRFRFLCERGHRELMAELRWSPEQCQTTGDGIDVETLELTDLDRLAVSLLKNPATLDVLREVGGAKLAEPGRRAVAASSAIGLLTMEGGGDQVFFNGGMAVQRVWLAATELGLAFQPLSAAPYLCARLEHGGEGLSRDESDRLQPMRDAFFHLFPVARGRGALLLFRLGVAGPARARSLRRPLAEVVSIELSCDSQA